MDTTATHGLIALVTVKVLSQQGKQVFVRVKQNILSQANFPHNIVTHSKVKQNKCTLFNLFK